MFDCARTARLSSDERTDEIAAVLAAGLLRLDQRAALPAAAPPRNFDLAANAGVFGNPAPEDPAKQPPEGLELSGSARLSVRVG